MASITKEEYEYFKNKDPKTLTQEEHNWINEYESEAAGAPSKEDVAWATHILNEKDPRVQAVYRENGDFKRATEILNKQRSARSLMMNEGKSPWVHQVSKVPDDIAKGYGFQFNWKDAYEKENDTKLRPTEADAEKLEKFISSKMYDVDDDVNFQKIAYNMHMWNPNTSNWSEFIQSENGESFKKYIKDVEKYQRNKAIEKIFSGEDPVKVNYPLIGPTDIPLSSEMVDFMLPVSKGYAEKEIKEGNDPDLTAPLAFDLAANLAMMGAGKSSIGALTGKPTITGIYGNFAAPVITETGNVVMNDKPISKAGVAALEGGLVNANTPFFLSRVGNATQRFQGPLSRTYSKEAQKLINDAADKAAEVANRKKNGAIWREGKDWFKMVDGEKTKIRMNKSEVGKDIISDADIAIAKEGDQFRRGVKKTEEAIETAAKRELLSEKSNKWARIVAEKVAKGQTPTYAELQKAGMRSKESFTNFIGRLISENPTLKEYLTNAAGRPKVGQRGLGSLLNTMMPSIGLFKDEKDEKDTDKWYRYYGLK